MPNQLGLSGNVGRYSLPAWIVLGLKVWESYNLHAPRAVSASPQPSEETVFTTQLELAECRGALTSALSCPVEDEPRRTEPAESAGIHWDMNLGSLLGAVVGAVLTQLVRVLLYCRAGARGRQHYAENDESAGIEVYGQAYGQEDYTALSPVGRRRLGGGVLC